MSDVDRLYREGVRAIRSSDSQTGRARLLEVVRRDPFHEQAWLWLSAVASSDDERIICLENVLTINPFNEAARRGLERLGADVPPLPPISDSSPTPAAEPTPPPTPPVLPQVDVGPVTHAAPHAVGMGLHDVLSGVPSETRPVEGPQSGASWHDARLAAEPPTSTATLVPPLEPPRRLSLAHLVGVWGQVGLFKVRGGLVDEARHGGPGHIFASLSVAVVLQFVAGATLLLILLAQPGPDLAAYLSPVANAFEELADIPDSPPGGDAVGALFSLLGGPARVNQGLDRLVEFGGQLREWAASASASPGQVLLAYAALSIILVFSGQIYRSVIATGIARYLNGSGDLLATTQALSIALIPAQLAQMPLAVLAPFMPVWFLVWGLTVVQLYRLILSAAVLRPVHRFGWLIALGVVIAAGMIMVATVGGIFSLLSALAAT